MVALLSKAACTIFRHTSLRFNHLGCNLSWLLTRLHTTARGSGTDGSRPENEHQRQTWEKAGGVSLPEEELALFTDNKESRPMIEAVLNAPMRRDEWDLMPQGQKDMLTRMGQILSTKRLPSVSKILSETKSPLNELILARWKKKKVQELGEEGFENYMTGLRTQGHRFHTAVECHLTGRPVEEEMKDSDIWKSVLPVLGEVGEVHAVEIPISHPILSYVGRFDCVCTFRDSLCVFDWKSSQKRKETLSKCYDDPYQLAAYAGAFNISNDPSMQIMSAVIVKAYPDGTAADVHYLDGITLDYFWHGWLRRLAKHHIAALDAMTG